MNTVGIAVGLLDQSDQLVPVLKQLGKTHAFLELTAKEYQVSSGLRERQNHPEYLQASSGLRERQDRPEYLLR